MTIAMRANRGDEVITDAQRALPGFGLVLMDDIAF